MPKRKRVGQKRDCGNSRCEPCVLESNPESSKNNNNTKKRIQVSTMSPLKSEINTGEVTTILGDIEQRFVKWITEGVQTVQKDIVLEALRQIRTIKSFLNETTAILVYLENVRQRGNGDSIKPLMDSVDHLKMVIENYKKNVAHTEPEVKGHDLSFDDIFQDDSSEQNKSFCIQDSSTVKSILKSANVDYNITRKRISFAEKATKVYQDDETSQISLAKSSPQVKRLEGNTTERTEENPERTDSASNGLQAIPFQSTIPVHTPTLLDPNETSIAEESQSIIETSFLGDSVSCFHTNYTKNLKNFRPKVSGKKKRQDPDEKSQFTKEKPFNVFQNDPEKNSTIHQNFELVNTADFYTSPPHDIQDSNIFSDELVKTFMSQITENCDGDSITQLQENISLPFHNFFLSLPGSCSSQDSLDARVKMAVNVVTGSAMNSIGTNQGNDGVSNNKSKSEGIQNYSTEIIQSSEPFIGGTGWMGTPWENVKDNGNMASGNSSLNVSLLFDETNEASLIPGTSCPQNTNSFKDQTQIITKPILNAKDQDFANHTTEYEASAAQMGLQNAPQDCPLYEPRYNMSLSGLNNAPKAVGAPDMSESVKLQEIGKEKSPEMFTVWDNTFRSNRKPQEPGNPGPSQSFYPLDDMRNVLRPDSKQKTAATSDDTKKTLWKAPFFHPPSQIVDVFIHQQSISDLNEMQITKELKKVPGHESTFTGFNITKNLESTTSQYPKNTEPRSNNDENKGNNSELIQSGTGMMNTQGQRSNNKEVDVMVNRNIAPADSAQKNMETHFYQIPIGDSRQRILLEKNGSLTSMQQDRTKNVSNRFQETLMTGNWLMSGLQQNTMPNLSSSLKPISNLELCKTINEVSKNTISVSRQDLLGEIQKIQEVSLKFNMTPTDGELKNQMQGPNVEKGPETQGYSIQRTVVGHSTFKENQTDVWQPRKYSSFSAWTLSDTEPVEKGKNLNSNHQLWAEQSDTAHSSNQNQRHQTCLNQQVLNNNRDEITTKTLLNSSNTKLPQKPKPTTKKKKSSTPRTTRKNKSTDQKQQLGESFENSQNEKSSQKPKTTRKKSSQGRTKSSAQSHDFSLEDLNKDVTYNAQNLGLLLDWSQSAADKKGTLSGHESSDIQNTNNSRDILHRPIDMKMNKNIKGQGTAAAINQQRELFALDDHGVTQAGGWADVRQKSESQTHNTEQQSNQQMNFNFFNLLTSTNEGETSPNYQPVDGDLENEHINMDTIGNMELQSNQQQNYNDCTQLGSKMSYTERSNMPWVEDTKYISANADGNSSVSNTRDNKLGAVNGLKTDIQAETFSETPIEYTSMTQLSWGEMATCEIPSIFTRGCSPKHATENSNFPSANSKHHTPQEQLQIGDTTHTKPNDGNPVEYCSATQLSWGRSATCGIPVSSQEEFLGRDRNFTAIGGTQQTSKSPTHKEASGHGQIQNIASPTANSHVFKQPFAPNVTEGTDQSFSFSEFMQNIRLSSTENVYDSYTQPPESTTEEEEIEEILKNIQFVRMPQETEFIEANSIEELINDQTFIW